jgi:preprotein translocase subunit SecD
MKDIVYIVLGCLVASAAIAADPSTSQVFQIRQVFDKPSSNTEQMTLVRKGQVSGQQEVLFVSKMVLLDQADVKSAEVSTNTPNVPETDDLFRTHGAKPVQTVQIGIVFTEKGAKRLADITRMNIGKRLAFVIDGHLYSAPMIMSEIPDGKAEVAGGFDLQEAMEIVAKITQSLQK